MIRVHNMLTLNTRDYFTRSGWAGFNPLKGPKSGRGVSLLQWFYPRSAACLNPDWEGFTSAFPANFPFLFKELPFSVRPPLFHLLPHRLFLVLPSCFSWSVHAEILTVRIGLVQPQQINFHTGAGLLLLPHWLSHSLVLL